MAVQKPINGLKKTEKALQISVSNPYSCKKSKNSNICIQSQKPTKNSEGQIKSIKASKANSKKIMLHELLKSKNVDIKDCEAEYSCDRNFVEFSFVGENKTYTLYI